MSRNGGCVCFRISWRRSSCFIVESQTNCTSQHHTATERLPRPNYFEWKACYDSGPRCRCRSAVVTAGVWIKRIARRECVLVLPNRTPGVFWLRSKPQITVSDRTTAEHDGLQRSDSFEPELYMVWPLAPLPLRDIDSSFAGRKQSCENGQSVLVRQQQAIRQEAKKELRFILFATALFLRELVAKPAGVCRGLDSPASVMFLECASYCFFRVHCCCWGGNGVSAKIAPNDENRMLISLDRRKNAFMLSTVPRFGK